MTKIKNLWAWAVAAVGALVGFLFYYLSLKNKEINSLRAKVDLADTVKETDVLEVEIKQIRDSKKLLKKEEKEIQKTLEKLEEKRTEIEKDVKKMSVDELAEYWNKS